MSQILTDILESLRVEYVQILQHKSGSQPLLSAEKLCAAQLQINTDQLADIVTQDPTLLAARAGGLIKSAEEADNPCAAVIIAVNIHNAAIEVLLDSAVHHGWLEVNSDGEMQIENAEIEAMDSIQTSDIDYSHSKTATANVAKREISALSQLLKGAEDEYMQQLDTQVLDAYSLAIQVAGAHSVFTPQEIAPLVSENPLLLALRADDLIIDDVFENDPPAGIIIGSHITQMVIDHLLDIATEKGALAFDSQGQLILPGNESLDPVVH
jgi:hypothetical protein